MGTNSTYSSTRIVRVIEGLDRIHVHPNYGGIGGTNDVAIIELHESLLFAPQSGIQAISLAASMPGEGKATFIGWGRIYRGWLPTTKAKKLDLTIKSSTATTISPMTEALDVLRGENEFCAYGDKESPQDGDSGGPLQIEFTLRDGSPGWLQIGILARGGLTASSPRMFYCCFGCIKRPCVDSFVLEAFTATAPYCDWMKKVIQETFECV